VKRIVLTFGLIAGSILSVMMLVTLGFQDSIDFDHGEVIGYTSMVLAFLLIFFGVKSFRDNVAGGSVTFGRALGVGVLIAVVASVCYVITWQVIYYKLAPDFAEKYQAHVLEKARADGESEAQLATRKVDMEKFMKLYENPIINVGISFLEPLPVALVIALVSAGVLSRRRKEGLLANPPVSARTQ